MYGLVIDGYLRDEGSLVAMLGEARGCGNTSIARLARDGWTVVVRRAGSDCGPLRHVPTGRDVHRRPALRLRGRRTR